MSKIEIRKAMPNDIEIVYKFLKDLANYERATDKFVATIEDIRSACSGRNPYIEVLIVSIDGVDVGFATYLFSFTTFLGRPKMFVEDIFISPEYRRFGAGRALFMKLAAIAQEHDAAKIELQVLNWNDSAVDFYEALGADFVSNWLPYAIEKEHYIKLLA